MGKNKNLKKERQKQIKEQIKKQKLNSAKGNSESPTSKVNAKRKSIREVKQKKESDFPSDEYFLEFANNHPGLLDLDQEKSSDSEKITSAKEYFESSYQSDDDDEFEEYLGIINLGNNQLYLRDFEHIVEFFIPKDLGDKYAAFEYFDVEEEDLEIDGYYEDYYSCLRELNKDPDNPIVKIQFHGLYPIEETELASVEDLLDFHGIDTELSKYLDDDFMYKPALSKMKPK